MALPLAPTDLPAELTGLIAEFGKAWASSVHQPVPEPAIRREWDDLLLEWSKKTLNNN